MTTDAEYRALAERLEKKAALDDMGRKPDPRTLERRASSAILALLEERDAATKVAEMNATAGAFTARQLATMQSRLGKAVEALEKIAGLTDAEAHVCGEMLRNYARSVLSDLEKSE